MVVVKALPLKEVKLMEQLRDESDRTYFEAFGIEQSFIVDVEVLHKTFEQEQTYLTEALMLHQNPEKMKENMEKAAFLNQAYSTLLNPKLRLLYLVKLHGYDLSQEEVIVSPGFRMASMNILSALEEAKTSDKPYAAFREVLKRVSVRIEGISRDLEMIADDLDDVLDWQPLVSNLNELEFYLDIQAQSQALLYEFLRKSKSAKKK